MKEIKVNDITLQYEIGDCLELMRDIPDESVDLIFADPDFNVGKHKKDKRINYKKWCEEWVGEGFRTLKATGSFYLMTISRHLEWKMPTMAHYGHFINLIIWRNVASACNKRQFWPEYQPILLYGKSENYIFNTYAETEETGHRRWGRYSTEYKGQIKDRWEDIPMVYAGSITHPEAVLKPNTNKKAHPCQMPLDLIERAIHFSSKKGDTILDPFLGSGTTLLACRKTGRNGIGFEINPDYEPIIRKRIMADIKPVEGYKPIDNYEEGVLNG